MKNLPVSKLAMYYTDKKAFCKTKGIVKKTKNVKYGVKVHDEMVSSVDYSRYILIIILGLACYYFIR